MAAMHDCPRCCCTADSPRSQNRPTPSPWEPLHDAALVLRRRLPRQHRGPLLLATLCRLAAAATARGPDTAPARLTRRLRVGPLRGALLRLPPPLRARGAALPLRPRGGRPLLLLALLLPSVLRFILQCAGSCWLASDCHGTKAHD